MVSTNVSVIVCDPTVPVRTASSAGNVDGCGAVL